MSVKFDYEYAGKIPFGEIYTPVANVTFFSPDAKVSVNTWMIVDTGANFTMLPRRFVEELQLSLKKDCIKDEAFGIGGEQTIYFCKEKLKAKIGDLERHIPLAFFDTDEVPPLLGRLGFLETFEVEFLKSHVVMFKG